MSISDLLTQLANNVINDDILAQLIDAQPEEIKSAMQANDSERFKACVSDKQYFSNTCMVTTY